MIIDLPAYGARDKDKTIDIDLSNVFFVLSHDTLYSLENDSISNTQNKNVYSIEDTEDYVPMTISDCVAEFVYLDINDKYQYIDLVDDLLKGDESLQALYGFRQHFTKDTILNWYRSYVNEHFSGRPIISCMFQHSQLKNSIETITNYDVSI